jgi:hypothetical protein
MGRPVVAAADLTPFREIMGKPIEGILGMDVLRKLVVRLDCRGRTLTLEETAGFEAPTGAGVSSHDIVYVSGVPSATMALLGLPAQRWGFDMGAAKSFAVIAGTTGQALEAFTLGSEALANADLAGEYQSKALEVRREWSFAGTRYRRVRVDVAPRVPVDLVGLEFLADYAVTFDFPHGRVYLESSAAEHVSRRSLGFGAIVREGQYLIRDPNPEIAALGVREGDELVAANGAPIAGREPWAVARELRESPRPTITLKRGGRTITAALPREETATRPAAGK